MHSEKEAVAKAVEYLKNKFGEETEVEISEIYRYSAGVVEISGTFKKHGDRIKRRFTVKLRLDDMKVIAFGVR